MTRIDSLLGAMHERPTAPDKPSEKLDLSRCVVYPTRSQNVAEARFKARFGVTPSVSMQASIGGRTKVAGWLVGMIPVGWSESDE